MQSLFLNDHEYLTIGKCDGVNYGLTHATMVSTTMKTCVPKMVGLIMALPLVPIILVSTGMVQKDWIDHGLTLDANVD